MISNVNPPSKVIRSHQSMWSICRSELMWNTVLISPAAVWIVLFIIIYVGDKNGEYTKSEFYGFYGFFQCLWYILKNADIDDIDTVILTMNVSFCIIYILFLIWLYTRCETNCFLRDSIFTVTYDATTQMISIKTEHIRCGYCTSSPTVVWESHISNIFFVGYLGMYQESLYRIYLVKHRDTSTEESKFDESCDVVCYEEFITMMTSLKQSYDLKMEIMDFSGMSIIERAFRFAGIYTHGEVTFAVGDEVIVTNEFDWDSDEYIWKYGSVVQVDPDTKRVIKVQVDGKEEDASKWWVIIPKEPSSLAEVHTQEKEVAFVPEDEVKVKNEFIWDSDELIWKHVSVEQVDIENASKWWAIVPKKLSLF